MNILINKLTLGDFSLKNPINYYTVDKNKFIPSTHFMNPISYNYFFDHYFYYNLLVLLKQL